MHDNGSIYCVMSRGDISLTDEIRRELLRGAMLLAQKKENSARLKKEDFEAFITTSFREVSPGAIYGPIFTANVSTNEGVTEVEYIVRTRDLTSEIIEKGNWYVAGEEPVHAS